MRSRLACSPINPTATEIYNALFVDAGLQILRVANWYQNSQARGNPNDMGDFNSTAAVVAGARAALGHDPVILMSSWSPPPSIKSVNSFVGGTLGQTNGAYRYADFGQWWRASLDAYAAAGVVPTYVSIQNEPDFLPTGSNPWSSCLIDADRGPDPARRLRAGAGCGRGRDRRSAVRKPMLVGPEVSGIGGATIENYLEAITSRRRSRSTGWRRAPPVQRRKRIGCRRRSAAA